MANRPMFAGFTTLTLTATVVVALATTHRASTPSLSAVADAARASARRDTLRPPLGRSRLLLQDFCGLTPADTTISGCRVAGGHPQLRILIATVADPFASNLDWSYDADLEGVRRGFEAAGYLLDRFWLPARRDSVVVDGRMRPAGEQVPGVLLFRGRDTIAMLFVVHELPTGGVRKAALREALEEREALLNAWGSRSEHSLRIIGPSFSGSSVSLASVLDAAWKPPAKAPPTFIVSGSATDASIQRTLQSGGRKFFATVHADAALGQAARTIIESRLRVHRDRVAFLRESGTQYGEAAQQITPAKDAGRQDRPAFPVVLFPLNIASVRSAYDGDSPVRAGTEQMLGPHTTLTLHGGETDETPPIASANTPAAEELRISALVEELKRRRVLAVGLLATDVRDKLFLADVLRRRLPDVQLFTFGSQGLFLRDDYARQLRGMLVFTTYPLILQNQQWIGATDHPMLGFGLESEEGSFNATVYQLGRSDLMRDYAMPGAGGKAALRPPVWVTAVGTGAFVPMALLAGQDTQYVLAGSRPARAVAAEADGVPVIPVAVLLLGLLALVATCAAFLRQELGGGDDGVMHRQDEAGESAAEPARRKYVLSVVPVGVKWLTAERAVSVPAGGTPPASASSDGLDGVTASPGEGATEAGFVGAAIPAIKPQVVVKIQEAPLDAPRNVWRALGRRCRGEGPDLLICDRTAEKHLLHVHRRLYQLLRILLLATAITPPAMLLWQRDYLGTRTQGLLIGGGLAFGALVLAAVGLIAAQVVSLVAAIREHGLPIRRSRHRPRVRYVIVNYLGELIFPFVLLWYGSAILKYFMEIWRLGACGGDCWAEREFFWYRALQIGSGLSPIVPLTLMSLTLALWCTWHLRHESAIRRATLLESALRRNAEEETTIAKADEGTRLDKRVLKEPPPGTLKCIRGGMVLLRDRLFLLIPNVRAGVAFILLFGIAFWLKGEMQATRETVTSTQGASAFDPVFRIGTLTLLVATMWGVARLLAVWNQLADVLQRLAETPLRSAFARISGRLPGVAQPSLLGSARRKLLEAFSNQQWRRLGALQMTPSPADVAPRPHDDGEEALRRALRDSSCWSLLEQEQKRELLRTLCGSLDDLWEQADRALPAGVPDNSRSVGALAPEAGVPPRRSDGERVAGESASSSWLSAVEEFVAGHAVHYIEWAQESLRSLALILLGSLLLTTVLLYSYPFYPDRLFKLIFIAVLAVASFGMLYVTVQMSRDDVLSQITVSTPGKIEWDTNLALNVVLFAVVPLLAVLGSEIPAIHDFFFAWVDPILRSVQRI